MRIAIYGYGNLGRGVEAAIKYNKDAELIGIFTRRAPATVKTVTGAPVFPAGYSEPQERDRRTHNLRRKCNGSAENDA